MIRIAALLLCVVALAGGPRVATAATPAQGTVSAAAPQAKWSGTVSDPFGLAYLAAAGSGSTAEVCAAPASGCDSYTLKVEGESPVRLTVSVAAAVADDWVGLSVTTPAGEERTAFGGSAGETITVDRPAPGSYTVRVLASPGAAGADVDYAGIASLEIPPPPPPAPPRAPSSPPPPPPPPPEGSPPPAPPLQAGPRELAVDADVRRVARAVRRGFRARVVCRGGCETLRLRVFVSSLTARTYRIAKNPRGDVQVGGARARRAAEGRRVIKVTFKKSVRRKLARAKNLTIAVEAVATDADGRVRTALKRLFLRR